MGRDEGERERVIARARYLNEMPFMHHFSVGRPSFRTADAMDGIWDPFSLATCHEEENKQQQEAGPRGGGGGGTHDAGDADGRTGAGGV